MSDDQGTEGPGGGLGMLDVGGRVFCDGRIGTVSALIRWPTGGLEVCVEFAGAGWEWLPEGRVVLVREGS